MEATQPRSLTSPGTPTSPGSSAQCLKTTLCKFGKWWVNWDHILLIHVGSKELDFFFIVFYSNRENYLRLTCAGTCTGLQQPGTSAPSVIPKQGVEQSKPLWKKVVRWDFPETSDIQLQDRHPSQIKNFNEIFGVSLWEPHSKAWDRKGWQR